MVYLIFLVYWLAMLVIVLPGSKLMKREKPEWQELAELRKYMRSEEFRRKQELMLAEMWK